MLKHFYENDIEKIPVNSTLKNKLAHKLFDERKSSAIGYRRMVVVPLLVALFLVLPAIYLFTLSRESDASMESFFERAKAAYSNEPQLENLIYHLKTHLKPGADPLGYQKMINEKQLKYTAIHQPEKLSLAQQMMEEGHSAPLEFAPFYPGKEKSHETWFDLAGNYLNLYFVNGERKQSHLQIFDPQTGVFAQYDNHKFPGLIQPEGVVTQCVELPPEKSTPTQKGYLLRISFLEDGSTKVHANLLASGKTIDTAQLFHGVDIQSVPEKFESLHTLSEALSSDDPSKNPQKTLKILEAIQNSDFPNVSFEYRGEITEQGSVIKVFRLRYPGEIWINYLTDYELKYDFKVPAIQQADYSFDATTYQLEKITHSQEIDGKTYEMAVTELTREYLEKSEHENIFDPSLYPDMIKYQAEPGCYINENDQEMTKMTPGQEINFWASASYWQKQAIQKQRREALEQVRE